MLNLAKPALDVGLYTNQLDQMLSFWQNDAAVPFDHLLKLGGGVHQHRHQIGDSVLKINNHREPIAQGEPTGLSQLTIYQPDRDHPSTLADPDGNQLVLAPADGTHNLKLSLTVNDLDAHHQFYADILGLPEHSTHTYTIGASLLELTPGRRSAFQREGIGLRYMTVQVFDVVAEHSRILAAGGTEGMAPVRLGDVAYISFVCDPDGNWIEISQRKSITGSLA
ncbi:MAG: VOC family protein [Pseudomonadota bacterium]